MSAAVRIAVLKASPSSRVASFSAPERAEALLAHFSDEERQVWFTLSPEERVAVRALYTQHVPPTDELRELTRQLFVRTRAGDGRILRRENFIGANVHECLNKCRCLGGGASGPSTLVSALRARKKRYG